MWGLCVCGATSLTITREWKPNHRPAKLNRRAIVLVLLITILPLDYFLAVKALRASTKLLLHPNSENVASLQVFAPRAIMHCDLLLTKV